MHCALLARTADRPHYTSTPLCVSTSFILLHISYLIVTHVARGCMQHIVLKCIWPNMLRGQNTRARTNTHSGAHTSFHANKKSCGKEYLHAHLPCNRYPSSFRVASMSASVIRHSYCLALPLFVRRYICMQLLHAEENHGSALCAWANVPHTATRRLATSEACGVRQMWQATRR